MTDTEVETAIMAAADTWNSQANGARFVYTGSTTVTDASCSGGYSVVVFNDSQSNDSGTSVGKCPDPDGSGDDDQFLITIWGIKFGTTTDRQWGVGDPVSINPGSVRKDLTAILTHEFGHAMGLGHPSTSNARAVMNQSDQRDLYQLDQECVEKEHDAETGSETRTGYAVSYAFVNGAFPSSYSLIYTGPPKASPSKSGAAWRGAYLNASCGWAEYSSGARCVDSGSFRVGPTRAQLFETSGDEVVFFGNDTALDYGDDLLERFPVRGVRSNNGFNTSWASSDIFQCTTLDGWKSCAGVERITSPRRPAIAYDAYTNNSVMAWTIQDRSDKSVDRALMVSIGHDLWNWWMPGVDFGVRSPVGPGLACETLTAGSYDCIVGYTDIADPTGVVRFRRFWAGSPGTYHDSPVLESSEQFISSNLTHRTTSDIAIWRHDDYWYVGYKPANYISANKVRIYRSTTGATGTWSYQGVLSLWSPTGPYVDGTLISGDQHVWLMY